MDRYWSLLAPWPNKMRKQNNCGVTQCTDHNRMSKQMIYLRISVIVSNIFYVSSNPWHVHWCRCDGCSLPGQWTRNKTEHLVVFLDKQDYRVAGQGWLICPAHQMFPSTKLCKSQRYNAPVSSQDASVKLISCWEKLAKNKYTPRVNEPVKLQHFSGLSRSPQAINWKHALIAFILTTGDF